MDWLFQQKPKSDPAKVAQLKAWIAEAWSLNPDIPISVSQLACSEPGCPPIETAITLMSSPSEQYKIHKPLEAIEQADVFALFSNLKPNSEQ